MLRTMVIDLFALLLKWPTQRKRMPTTSDYLLSTSHSKDVRFLWVTLYYWHLLYWGLEGMLKVDWFASWILPSCFTERKQCLFSWSRCFVSHLNVLRAVIIIQFPVPQH
jgi:hypothetical protein